MGGDETKVFNYTLPKRVLWKEPQTLEIHAPYMGGQVPRILLAAAWEKRTGEDYARGN